MTCTVSARPATTPLFRSVAWIKSHYTMKSPPANKPLPLICRPVWRWVPFVVSSGVSLLVLNGFNAAPHEDPGFFLEVFLFLGELALLVVQFVAAIGLGCTAGWVACLGGCVRLAIAVNLFYVAFDSHFNYPYEDDNAWREGQASSHRVQGGPLATAKAEEIRPQHS